MPETEPSKPLKRGPKPGFRKGEPRLGGIQEGYKFPHTLQKEEGKRILQQIVLSRLRPIVEAGVDSAMGIRHFMLRDPATGQFKRLTDPVEIDAALSHPDASEGSTYWIYTKDPDTNARKDMLDRAIGKPKEEIELEHKGEIAITDRLKRAKEKALGR